MAIIRIDEHLLLRNYEIEDADRLFEAVDNSRQHLGPWLNWVAKTKKPEDSLEFIQQSKHQLHAQEGVALGVFYDDKIIGGVSMFEWQHETRNAQIGYWICAEYEGRGIVARSLEAFMAYLFDQIGLYKIEVHYVPANKRSAKVAEKLGFKVEGVLRQRFLRNGVIEDLVITGLLKSEWKNNMHK